MSKHFIKITLILFSTILMASCADSKKPADYVDPFIGTDFHGHTYPGATTPFGAVQLSPDTRRNNWDASSGYHYSDSTLLGFSHLHLSGTGVGDLGDILFHPTVADLKLKPEGYIFDPHPFSHKNEEASPGYYKVLLHEQKITAELTATPRVGVHRYTFPQSESAKIIIDLWHSVYDEEINHLELNVTGNNEITGIRVSSGWTPNQHIHFVAKFSKPFKSVQLVADGQIQQNSEHLTGKNIQAILEFETGHNEKIEANVGTSVVSIENARLNLEAEAHEINFEATLAETKKIWDDALGQITIEGATREQKRTFYTALYHTLIVPNVVSDVNGEYRSHNMTIKKAPQGRRMYSTLSLWDTFRTWHPLMTMINDQLVEDIIFSMMSMYEDTGELPIWPLVSGETGTMIGYHSVSVIWDAYQKGISGFDAEAAFEAMKVSSMSHRKGGKYYVENGFIPSNSHKESVSCVLEYAYDDWCIAQMAKELGRTDDHHYYAGRAESWLNVFDGQTRFFRGKRVDGNWDPQFEPLEASKHYTEANAWQYRFFVPHDNLGLMNQFGSREAFIDALDALFSETSEVLTDIPDITGLIGQYAHGNEPSHHKAYIYNYIGQPWKTQEWIRYILANKYSDQPDGIVGNEDCGQMSAWYIMSSLGIYPVTPGSGEYVLTSPLFEKATINLHNGNTLTITSNNPSKNTYIENVMWNGTEISANFVNHAELMQGGTLNFALTNEPVINRGIDPGDAPYSMTNKQRVAVPYITNDLYLFRDEVTIEIGSATPGTTIHFTLDGSMPDTTSQIFTQPFTIEQDATIKAIAYKDGLVESPMMEISAAKARYRDPDQTSATTNGVNYRFFKGKFAYTHEMFATPVINYGVMDEPDISMAGDTDDFAFEFTGLLYIDEDGLYDFYTESDDGSMLFIGNQPVVENDGSHGVIRATGRVALKKGYHNYRLLYFEDYAGQKLEWGWTNIDDDKPLLKANKSDLFLQ